jgi:hypothetical protein
MSQHSVKFDEAKRHAVYARDGYRCAASVRIPAPASLRGAKAPPKSLVADFAAVAFDLRLEITTCGPCNYSKQEKTPRQFNAYLKAKGVEAIDWDKVRRQARKKIDIEVGEENAVAARAYREAKGEPMPPAPEVPEAKGEMGKWAEKALDPATKDEAAQLGPGVRHDERGRFRPGGS